MATVNVITSAQLQSIRDKISPPQTTDKSKYLLALHEKSQIRADGWPNTLEAQRHRKDRARKERLAALEAVRQQQDGVVTEEKERSRRATLERVNKMIFHETDPAKGFHSAALHCDVLAERSAQIEFKQQIATLRSAQDEAFHRQMREQVALAEDAEVAKLMEARDRAMEQKAAQLQQLEDVKARVLADRAANKIEGEELKAKAKAEMEAEREKQAAARARAQAANEATAQAKEALKKYRLAQDQLAADAEAARIAYLDNKEKLAAQQKERAAAIAAEKEARRKAMVEIMESKFKEFMSNEAERLDRDVKQAEEKSVAEAEARAALRRKEWRAICQSREQQLNSKKAQQTEALEADKAFAAAWKMRMQQLVEEELVEAEARRSRNRHVAAFQKHQSNLKSKKKCAVKQAALQDAAMIEDLNTGSKRRFEKYAREFMEEYQRQGKPIKPMQLMLAKPPAFDSA